MQSYGSIPDKQIEEAPKYEDVRVSRIVGYADCPFGNSDAPGSRWVPPGARPTSLVSPQDFGLRARKLKLPESSSWRRACGLRGSDSSLLSSSKASHFE